MLLKRLPTISAPTPTNRFNPSKCYSNGSPIWAQLGPWASFNPSKCYSNLYSKAFMVWENGSFNPSKCYSNNRCQHGHSCFYHPVSTLLSATQTKSNEKNKSLKPSFNPSKCYSNNFFHSRSETSCLGFNPSKCYSNKIRKTLGSLRTMFQPF